MATALLLARDGHRVTIFERFEEARAVGSGLMLQPTGLAVLGSLGLADEALARGQRIDRICGKAATRTVLEVHYSSLRNADAFGVGIHRAALFSLLRDAVGRAKISVASGHEVLAREQRQGGEWLRFADQTDDGPFHLIVDASGARSCLAGPAGRDLPFGALWANVDFLRGFDEHALSQRYRRASKMAGVLPIGRPNGDERPQAAFFWSHRARDHEKWLGGNLESWKREVLDLWPETQPILDQIASHEALTFARYAHKTIRRPASKGLIHIGDAWHSASPQLGQGANMALMDAYALALALRRGRDVAEALSIAVALRARHVRLYQLLTALLTPIYQSDSRTIPLLRDWLMGPLSKLWPLTSLQAALVSGLVGWPLRKLDLSFAQLHAAR